MKDMAKLCKHCGKYPVFSHDHCLGCQRFRKDKKYLKSVLKSYKKQKGTIKPISDKRKQENIKYEKAKKEKEAQLKAEGKWRCFFSDIPLKEEERPSWHHLKGRDGDLFCDPYYLVPSYDLYHVYKYHKLTVKELMLESWYEGFLQRLKEIDVKLYEKEINKREK
jgi:hypothetical protein